MLAKDERRMSLKDQRSAHALTRTENARTQSLGRTVVSVASVTCSTEIAGYTLRCRVAVLVSLRVTLTHRMGVFNR